MANAPLINEIATLEDSDQLKLDVVLESKVMTAKYKVTRVDVSDWCDKALDILRRYEPGSYRSLKLLEIVVADENNSFD